jgi:tellurite resistance protein TerC
MQITQTVWIVTLLAIVGIFIFDLLIVNSRPHAFGPKEAARWVAFYIAAALVFAVFIWTQYGSQYGQEFLAGWVMEYSLSVDNLFVFLVLMSSFSVPADQKHRVLLIGILIAIFLRGILIVIGAAAIQRFAITFFVFAAFLLYTAISVWRSQDKEPDPDGNGFIRLIERFVPTVREYSGSKMVIKKDGKRFITPMFLVIVAIGTTDLLFALDSIPAVYGLTKEPYLVFTVNAFALMGLRQLFFLLDGLLARIIYLPRGLAIVLGFIAFKLFLEAIHETTSLAVPTITISQSLTVIALTLTVTVLTSLRSVKLHPELIRESDFTDAVEESVEHSGEAISNLGKIDKVE